LSRILRFLSPNVAWIWIYSRANAYQYHTLCFLLFHAGACLEFCQGGCTFLADPPPPDLGLDPDPHMMRTEAVEWTEQGYLG
jgi:hypothetical protein